MTGGFYYAPRKARSGDTIVLPPEESRHALRVMRLARGAEIQIVDGEGTWYLARILDVERGIVTTEILSTRKDVGEPDHELILGLGVIKSARRFETFLEKAVEFGVSTIIPLETERTQRAGLNRSRCERVMIAGLKQSMRSRLPVITEIQSLETVVKARTEDGVTLVAHEGASSDASLLSYFESVRRATRCVVLVGPEGGFSDAEIEMAASNGWEQVSLGTSRLRAETAAIAASAVIHMIKSKQNESDRTQD